MATAEDKKRLKRMTGRLAWVMGKTPEKFEGKGDDSKIVPLTEEELNAVLFPKAVVAKLYVPVAPEDEPIERYNNPKLKIHLDKEKAFDKLNGDTAYYDYIDVPAGTTLKGYADIVNKFYRRKVKKDDPRFQTPAGKKLIGKTFLSLLTTHVFYEGDATYQSFTKNGIPVVFFGLA